MSYSKFDDPPLKRANDARKTVDSVIPQEAVRRALQSVLNRVIGGTGGTGDGMAAGTAAVAGLGTGSTCGIKIANPLLILVNGRFGTAAAQDNLYLPDGSQSKSTYVKYLVAVREGTRGTVILGNESTAATSALLPDCPDGYVCVGYMEYATGTAGAFKRLGGGTAGAQNVLSGNGAATCGTVNAWQNLVHMPLSEA